MATTECLREPDQPALFAFATSSLPSSRYPSVNRDVTTDPRSATSEDKPADIDANRYEQVSRLSGVRDLASDLATWGTICVISHFNKVDVVANELVPRVTSLRFEQYLARLGVLALQYVMVTQIVEHDWRTARQVDQNIIGAACLVEPAQAIVRCRESKPGFRLALVQFDSAAKGLLSQSEFTLTVVSFSKFQRLFGG